MSRLRPEKLHVRMEPDTHLGDLTLPRRYTLTHSDATGDLFLTIGSDYDRKQISGWYTRLLRDEVLAEWCYDGERSTLHLLCHVSGGLVVGPAAWRDSVLRHELPLVLEALRHGDSALFEAHPELDQALIIVHFAARQQRYQRTEQWGAPADYRLSR